MKRKYDQVNSTVELESTNVESTNDYANVDAQNVCGLYSLMGCNDTWRMVFSYMGVPEVFILTRVYRPHPQFYNGSCRLNSDYLFGACKPITSFFSNINRGSEKTLHDAKTNLELLQQDSKKSEVEKRYMRQTDEYIQAHHKYNFCRFEVEIQRFIHGQNKSDNFKDVGSRFLKFLLVRQSDGEDFREANQVLLIWMLTNSPDCDQMYDSMRTEWFEQKNIE